MQISSQKKKPETFLLFANYLFCLLFFFVLTLKASHGIDISSVAILHLLFSLTMRKEELFALES